MKEPPEYIKRKIDNMPPTWKHLDFSKKMWNIEAKFYWFKTKRVWQWLINDTRNIYEKSGSMFGVAAMVCIGVDFISSFRYGSDNVEIYSIKFLEEYVHGDFATKINNPFSVNRILTKSEREHSNWIYDKEYSKYKSILKFSEIFRFGLRHQLMHWFMFKHVFLINPQRKFLDWKGEEKSLYIDIRQLVLYFENGLTLYLDQMQNADVGDEIVLNFSKIFSRVYETKY